MAHVWVGIQDVTVTPDGGDAILFAPTTDDSLELEVTTEDLVFKGASGQYDTTVVTTHISYQLTINTKELHVADSVLSNVEINGDCTVAWTLIGKDDASNRTYSLAAKLMNEPAVGGTDGMSASTSAIVFRGVASNGTTSPLTRPS